MTTRRSLPHIFSRLWREPPFRLLAREFVRLLPFSVCAKARWDVFRRPEYLFGVLKAAEQALAEGVTGVSVIEFGVAGGKGLLALQDAAALVTAETGVQTLVYGFDTAAGLPENCGDYRDHPDSWRPADFPMDLTLLTARLRPETSLIIGDVRDTLSSFIKEEQKKPLGFVAFDLDFWSSTTAALEAFRIEGRSMLRRTWLYFDDVDLEFCHSRAGELLAISEFNERNQHMRIEKARGIREARPFHEHSWLDRIYVAHDLEAISACQTDRARCEDHWHSL